MTSTKKDKFDQVFRALQPKMTNFARRLCMNRDEAEDVTQEAFIKAYNAFDQCEDTTRLDNWLMRIVYNTFLDLRRKKRRRITEMQSAFLNEEFSIEDQPDVSQSPEALLMDRTISPEMVSALNSLDAKSRELFRLAYIEQIDHIEIGRRFGIKPGASRSRAHRLCAQLRRTIMANRLANGGAR